MSKAKEAFKSCETNATFGEFSEVFDYLYKDESPIAWFKLKIPALSIKDPKALVTDHRILIFKKDNGGMLLEKEFFVGDLEELELEDKSMVYASIRINENLVLKKIPKNITNAILDELDIDKAPPKEEIKHTLDTKKWEYKRIQLNRNEIALGDKKIDRLGARGWELVNIVTTFSGFGSGTDHLHLYFKRPIST